MLYASKVAVVIPAYNEARLIANALDGVPAFVDDVIVVDDGSVDGTAAKAQAHARTSLVVRHPKNRGVGAALVSGYGVAFARGADVVAVMAGDAQMDGQNLEPLVRAVSEGRADYAKGNRLCYAGARRSMPFTRWFGNWCLTTLTRWATGLRITDSQCGYTALSRRAWERTPLTTLWPRYGYPNDMLFLAAQYGLRVAEVTVRPMYGDEVSGIGLRHALFVIPWVIMRGVSRRFTRRLLQRVEQQGEQQSVIAKTVGAVAER